MDRHRVSGKICPRGLTFLEEMHLRKGAWIELEIEFTDGCVVWSDADGVVAFARAGSEVCG
jgi:hypothetical protein